MGLRMQQQHEHLQSLEGFGSLNMQVFVPEVLVKRLGGERLGVFVGVRKQVFE